MTSTKDIIEQTKRLIAIRSTADNPAALRAAVGFVADVVQELCPDITIERFEQNSKPSFLAYRGTKRPEQFEILLNAHVDVVPAKANQFKAYEKDGRLYGRGALDMKGTALALTHLFCELVNEVPYGLGLQIVADEETSGYDGAQLQIAQGVKAKFVVIGEYTNAKHTIYNAARGLCWAEIAFHGKTAHGGHLWNGVNAVVKAGEFAGALLRRYPTPDQETWTTTASVASLSTPNVTYNKVPDQAVLKVDFRFTQEDPVFQDKETLRAFISSIDPDAELVHTAVFEPAVNVEELNPYVQGLAEAYEREVGKKPRFASRPAGSDGRHFAAAQMDVIEFGLYGLNPHSDNEYVELTSFEEYRRVVRRFLLQPQPTQVADPEPLHEKLLRRLVGMQTFSNSPSASYSALRFIEKFLRERGMHVATFEQNGFRSVLATTKPNTTTPTLLLNAHVDVVVAAPRRFELHRKKGNFVGRGVMDMKHAIACYLSLIDSLKDELDQYDLGIMITSDEEVGGMNGVKPLVEEHGWRPKVVIVPDGGNDWKLETFAKGTYWVELTAAGKSAHASRPWEGDSAIHNLLAAINAVQALVPANPKPTDTIVSVGTINGGTVPNVLAHEATAVLDVRTGSIEDHARMPAAIKKACQAHGVTAKVVASGHPCVCDPEDPLVKPFIEIVERVTGSQHKTSYDFAATDGRYFSAIGASTIVINPECGGIHTDEEWVSQKGLVQFQEVLSQYVQQVARKATETSKDEIARLMALFKNDKAARVWYVAYGTGLSRNNFMQQIIGGQPEGSIQTFEGCSDKTPPVHDQFISLPYALYFAGDCPHWVDRGGYVNIQPVPSSSAHTIARAYLITIDQFEEIVAQQNGRAGRQVLPLRQALQHGHATIGKGVGHYDELVFCGMKDNTPMFSVTAVKPELPYVPPSLSYTRLLCKGLSESAGFEKQEALDYMLHTPGIAGHYKKSELDKIFREVAPARRK